MKRLMLLFVMALAAAAVSYSADLSSLIDKAGLQALKPGTQIIDFNLDNLKGKSVSLSSFKGEVVLLNFWATWCGPCRSEMGSLENLYKKYEGNGFVVLAVNLQENPASVRNFAQKFGLTFPILLDRTGHVGLTYGARGIPITYLIDKKGDVTSGIMGAHEWTTPQMDNLLEALLNER